MGGGSAIVLIGYSRARFLRGHQHPFIPRRRLHPFSSSSVGDARGTAVGAGGDGHDVGTRQPRAARGLVPGADGQHVPRVRLATRPTPPRRCARPTRSGWWLESGPRRDPRHRRRGRHRLRHREAPARSSRAWRLLRDARGGGGDQRASRSRRRRRRGRDRVVTGNAPYARKMPSEKGQPVSGRRTCATEPRSTRWRRRWTRTTAQTRTRCGAWCTARASCGAFFPE